jgi:hypothetical protein
MSSMAIDPNPDKMNQLLERLEHGMLDRNAAMELKPLLQEQIEKARKKGKFQRADNLLLLVDILDSYISGRIDLMVQPEVVVSNVT